MTERGLLLLDVDGPLNPYNAKPHARPDGYTTWRRTPVGGWYGGKEARQYKGIRVWLHPDHGAQLAALANETGLELVWATTWQHEANTLIGPAIGLPPLPVIEFGPPEWTSAGWTETGRWKYSAVTAYAADRPVVWLDDDFHDRSWLDARNEFLRRRVDARTLLCDVDPRQGIQSHHLDLIRAWAFTPDMSR